MGTREFLTPCSAGHRVRPLFQPSWARFARSCLAAAGLCLLAAGAQSQPPPEAAAGIAALGELTPGPAGTVTAVIDPVTIRLAGEERPVRLAGLWYQPPRTEAGETAAAAATAFLRRHAAGRPARLYLNEAAQNRAGEHLAQLVVEATEGTGGIWLQGALLSHGLARVYTTHRTAALAETMLAREAEAREAGLGVWGNAAFAVRPVTGLADAPGSFQIVEGSVLAVAVTGNRVYLNFGEDWRSDFTVMIERSHASRFPGGLRGLRALAGRPVRVRGWVFGLNGPAIRADHGGVLEVLREKQ